MSKARRECRYWARVRSGGRCYWCRCELDAKNTTLDHVVPASAGGTYDETNVVACRPLCNNARANAPFHVYADAVQRAWAHAEQSSEPYHRPKLRGDEVTTLSNREWRKRRSPALPVGDEHTGGES